MDKRKRPRVPFNLEVSLELPGDEEVLCKTKDLSMSGVYLFSQRKLSMGETGVLKIRLTGGDEEILIRPEFKVIRCDAENDPQGGYGLKFNSLKTEDSIHLFNIIRYQNPN